VSPRAVVLAAVACAIAWPAAAQPSLDASIGTSLQSLSTPALGAHDTQSALGGGAGVGLDFDGARGHLGYGLDAGAYASAGDWSYRLHRLDARYRIDLSHGGTRLHAGATGALRRNGDAWADADYDAVGAFMNLETAPRAGFTLRTGYRIDRRTFDAMPSLDQTEHGAFASLLFNLPSRTTLIGEARAGVKSYRGAVVALDAAAAPPADDPVPATTATGDGSSGQGRGGGRAGAAGAGAMGPGTRPAPPAVGVASSDHAQQLTLLGRVAQSLGERTGLSVQATWRGTGGSVPPAVVTTPAGFFDDGVYDDPFASGLAAAELRLKHVRPGGAVLEASARRFVQSYTAALALGADGLPLPDDALREDRVWRASASVVLPILPSRTGAFDARLQIGYAFTHSASNDAFYDYRDHAGGVALSLGY
jgi:hypothetical protein